MATSIDRRHSAGRVGIRHRRFWRFGCISLVVLLLGPFPAAPSLAVEDPLAFVQRAINLSIDWREDVGQPRINDLSVATFTASDGPHQGETVPSISAAISDVPIMPSFCFMSSLG